MAERRWRAGLYHGCGTICDVRSHTDISPTCRLINAKIRDKKQHVYSFLSRGLIPAASIILLPPLLSSGPGSAIRDCGDMSPPLSVRG